MPTSTVPCRAKDPETCPYHGAQIKAEAALLRGDMDAWLTENTKMMAARNIAEVQDFIQSQVAEKPQVDVDLGAMDDDEDPYNFMSRYADMQREISDKSRPLGGIGLAIGNPEDDLDPVVGSKHVAYQAVADWVISSIIDRNPDDHFLVASTSKVLREIDEQIDHTHKTRQWDLAGGYNTARKEIEDATFKPNDEIDVRQALQNLTLGYDIEVNKARIAAQQL